MIAVADLPLVWIFLTALKPDQEVVRYPPTLLPQSLTLQNFANLFSISPFGTYLANSAAAACGTTVATIALSSCAGYALARFRSPLLQLVGGLSLVSYMLPQILLVVPVAQVITELHLTSNVAALVIVYTATWLPFGLWMLRSYFVGVAVDLEEAAMVDGCTRFGAFTRVVLPLAVPGLVAAGVFVFNESWSEYLFASVLLSDPSSLTLSPGLAGLMTQTGVYSWGLLMAGALIMTLPSLALFVIAQRQLVGGMAEGAVKA